MIETAYARSLVRRRPLSLSAGVAEEIAQPVEVARGSSCGGLSAPHRRHFHQRRAADARGSGCSGPGAFTTISAASS